MEDDFVDFLIKAPLKESPSSQYQRFLDERSKDSQDIVVEECYRRNLFDLSFLSGVENIDLSNLSESEEPTLGDIVGDFADHDHPEWQEEPEFIELIKAALPMLKSAGLLGDLLLLFKLVGRSQFPLSNISLLLFLDVVRFYGCSNASRMRYRKETLLYWVFGYLLFHGKWLRFSRGMKFSGHTLSEDASSTQGHFNPDGCHINFAVPSNAILRKSLEKDGCIPRNLDPGIVMPMLESLAQQVRKAL